MAENSPDHMRVADVPRPKKRPAAKDDDGVRVLGFPTAHCRDCRTTTPMLKPKRRESNGIAITSGRCSVCKREVYRVGAAGSLG